jgi:SAM-dependent methyltransferase
LLAQILPRLIGYRCLQIDGLGLERQVLEYAATLCQWRIGASDIPGVDICFDGQHLPLASGSVDALVLTHALEAGDAPHALLRECARVLNDRGQLIVLVFNPLSPGSLRRNWLSTRPAPPSAFRLCDWLRLLAFEPEPLWRYGPGFPLFGRLWQAGDRNRWLRSIAWSAPAYAITARRQVALRTPLFHRRRERRRRLAVALARESAQRIKCRR